MAINQKRFISMLLEVIENDGEIQQGRQLIIATDFEDRISKVPVVKNCYTDLLHILESTDDFPDNNGPKYDVMLLNHSQLGSRLIEFDEEQHFTPHRIKSIQVFKEYLSFSSDYEELFSKEDVRAYAIRKNRITRALDLNTFNNLEESIESLKNYVEKNHVNSNYIRPARGFNYPGGRLAQRAAYDLMKDLFHLIEPGFEPIIRFNVFEFELEYGLKFKHCTDDQIKALIYRKLDNLGLK